MSDSDQDLIKQIRTELYKFEGIKRWWESRQETERGNEGRKDLGKSEVQKERLERLKRKLVMESRTLIRWAK